MTGEIRRVVVTSPRTALARVPRRWPLVRDLDEQTELGAAFVRSLMRAQLRLALYGSASVLAVVGGLPMVFSLLPRLGTVRLAGVPLPWLVLALCIQPVWILVAVWHVRMAERVERQFTELVEKS
jgi:hypothetical protein